MIENETLILSLSMADESTYQFDFPYWVMQEVNDFVAEPLFTNTTWLEEDQTLPSRQHTVLEAYDLNYRIPR
jgi:hypothetical protein